MSNKDRRQSVFYDGFHGKSTKQKKIISEDDYTYSNILSFLNGQVLNKNVRKVLDFGCGVGTISTYLASIGLDVTGIDISPKAIDIARQNAKSFSLKHVPTFYTLDQWPKAKPKERYDLVVCTEVLEHLLDDKKTLGDFSRILNKDAYLFITVPSENAPLYKLGLVKRFDKKVGHLRRYTLESISQKVAEAGFTIIQTEMNESILRNSLYIFSNFGFLIKLIRGPLVKAMRYIDKYLVNLFGESDIFILAQKI